jgi:hypothetical protein
MGENSHFEKLFILSSGEHSVFYFPHIYGKVLVSPPENQKKIAFFHVLGLIIPKKHV